ncbi:hypothetical protein EF808_04495 [archaeon]|nr:MAG: hypothetical protein EF808_04495 [archaeon]
MKVMDTMKDGVTNIWYSTRSNLPLSRRKSPMGSILVSSTQYSTPRDKFYKGSIERMESRDPRISEEMDAMVKELKSAITVDRAIFDKAGTKYVLDTRMHSKNFRYKVSKKWEVKGKKRKPVSMSIKAVGMYTETFEDDWDISNLRTFDLKELRKLGLPTSTIVQIYALHLLTEDYMRQ